MVPAILCLAAAVTVIESRAAAPSEGGAAAAPGVSAAGTVARVFTEPAPPEPQAWPPGFRIERLEWERDLQPGQSVHVDNPHGDVRARLNGVSRLDVFAVIQSEARDPLKPDVEIRVAADGLRVAVRYAGAPSAGGAGPDGRSAPTHETPGAAGGNSSNAVAPIRRVDLAVFVPAGSSLHARTGRGAVEVRGLESDVAAVTTTGEVTVLTTGSVEARTTSGPVQAELRGAAWSKPPSFETQTGAITVRFPAAAGAVVRARTGGEITGDDSVEIERHPRAEGEEAVAVLGTGGGEVRIRSLEGDVRILVSR